jgi:hypothetical protein
MNRIYYIDTNNPRVVKAFLCGILFKCPSSKKPEDCQFHEIRKLPLKQRIKWLNSLSQKKLLDIYTRHKKCFKENNCNY